MPPPLQPSLSPLPKPEQDLTKRNQAGSEIKAREQTWQEGTESSQIEPRLELRRIACSVKQKGRKNLLAQ
jgi:hypothetical protein